MRTIITKLTVLMAMLLASVTASAYDFETDGIYYNIISEEDKTVEVTFNRSNNYSGKIDIPSIVIYNSKTYSVTSIGDLAFYECTGLTSVTIPSSVITIGEGAFSGCSVLINILVDEKNPAYCSIDGILYNKDVTVLIACPGKKESVTIPNTVNTIGESAFAYCRDLTSVTIPNSVISIGEYAFNNCTGLTSVTLPNSVTTIGDSAFHDCIGLTSIAIPNSVTIIGERTFSYCTSLTSVTIPNSVTTIGGYAFSYCEGLTSVTIPNSVISIGDYAFISCDGLTSLYCQATTPPEANNSSFSDTVLKKCKLYVPKGCKMDYEKVVPWCNFLYIEEMDFGGVDDVIYDSNADLHLKVENGVITIDGIFGYDTIVVYDAQGRVVYSGTDHIISNLARGTFIVKVRAATAKVVL